MKDKWLADRGLSIQWPVYGIMRKAFVDNGTEFRNKYIIPACAQHGIILEYRPPRTPHLGGHVESLAKTFHNALSSLSGFTFSNPTQRGEYKPEKEAVFTIRELEKWIAVRMLEIYHNEIHSSIQTTPFSKYTEGMKDGKTNSIRTLPRRVDENRIRLDFMPHEELTVQVYGIRWDYIKYSDPVLQKWIGARDPENPKLLRKFIVRRDPHNIQHVYFYDPDQEMYHKINSQLPTAMNVWELRKANEYLRQQGIEKIDEDLLVKATEILRGLEANAAHKTKMKKPRRNLERKMLSELMPQPAVSPTPGDTPPQHTATHPPKVKSFEENDW
ncbi:MAG: Mu transposase C-terminal domain-containing protein [Trueperaceae bacterium]